MKLEWEQQDDIGEDFSAEVGEFFFLNVCTGENANTWYYWVFFEDGQDMKTNRCSCGSATKEDAQRSAVLALRVILQSALEVLT